MWKKSQIGKLQLFLSAIAFVSVNPFKIKRALLLKLQFSEQKMLKSVKD